MGFTMLAIHAGASSPPIPIRAIKRDLFSLAMRKFHETRRHPDRVPWFKHCGSIRGNTVQMVWREEGAGRRGGEGGKTLQSKSG